MPGGSLSPLLGTLRASQGDTLFLTPFAGFFPVVRSCLFSLQALSGLPAPVGLLGNEQHSAAVMPGIESVAARGRG